MPTMRIRNAWKTGLNSQARRLTGSALSGAGVTISGVGAVVADGAGVGATVAPGASDAVGTADPAGACDAVIGSHAPTNSASASRAPASRAKRGIEARRVRVIGPGRTRPRGRDGSGR